MKQYKEGYDINGKIDGTDPAPEITYTPSFGERAENFWYHYKWHTLVALFVAFAVFVCTFQACSKTKYDVYVMYAGSEEISRTSEVDFSEYERALSSLESFCPDFDSDGVGRVSFSNLFILSQEEIDKIEAEVGYEVNYTLMQNDQKILSDRMIMLSDYYYVCLLSPHIYERYKTVQEVEMFAPIAAYLPEGSEAELYSDSAVKLGSLRAYELEGLSILPEDTLVCIRSRSAISSHFNASRTEEEYKRAEDYLRRLLSYGE